MDMEYLPVLIASASVFIPTVLAVGVVLGYRGWQDRERRRSPIPDHPHGAAAQIRKRIDEQGNAVGGGLVALFFLGPWFTATWALQRVQWNTVRFGTGDWLLLAAFVAGTAWAIARVMSNVTARRRCVAGLKAEMFTAQQLNRLMGAGCTVLHDVPADSFNLDHVVIGPRAVFLVETKSVRKPRGTGALGEFKVSFDGECLRFPNFVTRSAVFRTRRQARWLADYLKEATDRNVPVIASLALPGWWIEATPSSNIETVRVFNPAGRGANFMADGGGMRTIDAETSALIAQALLMRYPVAGK